ncbi:MAG: mechanosensitive ion channel [Caulobacterales bacterium]|nr:mechanosensitive ion channel [Caulobacterales bacterium]
MTDLTAVIDQGREALSLNAAVLDRTTEMAGNLAVNLVVAILILVATLFIAQWAGRVVSRMLGRARRSAPDPMLEGFLVQVVRVTVIAVGLVAVLQRLGVQTTSIIAVLGAASLAIGLALQGTLSNVAAGVMLLILRPYRVGDLVEVGDKTGVVQRLDLFTTRIIDANNRRITVPNSQVLGDAIVNISGQKTRRIELAMGVDYDSDLHEVMAVMKRVAADHPAVLDKPETWAGVVNFLDSSIEVMLHAWVKSGDYWQTRADLNLAMKTAFDHAGIVIPYPHQVDLHRSAAAPKPRKPKATPAPKARAPAPRARLSPAEKAQAAGGES